MDGITGIRAGSSGVFVTSLVPANGVLLSGPTFSVTDSNVELLPTNDSYAIMAMVAASNTAASFRLTISGTTSGGKVSNSFAIPIK